MQLQVLWGPLESPEQFAADFGCLDVEDWLAHSEDPSCPPWEVLPFRGPSALHAQRGLRKQLMRPTMRELFIVIAEKL